MATNFYIDLPVEGSTGGIVSINGDTTPAQTIAGGTGISVSTSAGTTTVTNTGGLNGFSYLASNTSVYGGTNSTLSFTGADNTVIGVNAGNALTSGTDNSLFGFNAGADITTGLRNFAFGSNALDTLVNGNANVAIGYSSLSGITGTSNNVAIGSLTLQSTTGSGSVALGYSAGRFETGSNAFYLNNVSQGTIANDKAYSLLYGNFSGSAGSASGQFLTVNGKFNVNGTANVGSLTASSVVQTDSSKNLVSAAVNLSSQVTSTLPVSHGGTGDTSLTAYAVLAGGTTSTGALQQVSGLGTSGYVLTSNGASTLPTWQPGGGGIPGANTQIIYNNAGVLAGSANLVFNNITDSMTIGSGSNQAAGTFLATTITVPIQPTLTTSFDFTGSSITEIGGSFVWNYSAYFQYTFSGSLPPVGNASPGAGSVTEGFQASNFNNSENNSGGSYTCFGQTFTYQIYPVYSGKTSTTSIQTTFHDTVNDFTTPFTVDLTWTAAVVQPDSYLVVNNTQNTYTSVSGSATSTTDPGTWSSSPSLPSTPLTYKIALALTDNSSGYHSISGYKYLITNNYSADSGEILVLSMTGASQNYSDDTSTGWATGSPAATSYTTNGIYTNGESTINSDLTVTGGTFVTANSTFGGSLVVASTFAAQANVNITQNISSIGGQSTVGNTGVASTMANTQHLSASTSLSPAVTLTSWSSGSTYVVNGAVNITAGTGTVQFVAHFTDTHGTARTVNMTSAMSLAVGYVTVPPFYFFTSNSNASTAMSIYSVVTGTITYDTDFTFSRLN